MNEAEWITEGYKRYQLECERERAERMPGIERHQREVERERAEFMAATDTFPCPRCGGSGDYSMVVLDDGGNEIAGTTGSCPPCMNTGRTTPKRWNYWCDGLAGRRTEPATSASDD
jgi:hypothetical protein